MNKIELFQSLHESDEILLLGNAWDLPSALILEQAGFRAIGTTSWGISASQGFMDGESLDFGIQLNTIKRIVDHVQVPVTADIESGYGQDDETIVNNVLKVAHLGAAGINIEDSLKGDDAGLKQIMNQSNLLSKIRRALVNNGFGQFYVNARIDTYLLHQDPLDDTLSRAKAYVESGASGIFVPGLKNAEEIKTIASYTPVPLNVMASPELTDCDELTKLGVRRLSLGGSVYRKAFKMLKQCAAELVNSRNASILFE